MIRTDVVMNGQPTSLPFSPAFIEQSMQPLNLPIFPQASGQDRLLSWVYENRTLVMAAGGGLLLLALMMRRR